MAISQTNPPAVYQAVRAVGILKPKLNPNQNGAFTNELQVIGTAFWLKEYKILVTCAHVVLKLFNAPVELTGLLVVGNKGKYNRAGIASLDNEHDLAVLRLMDVEAEQIIEQESQDGLEIVGQSPVVGMPVGYAGFPFGNQLMSSNHSPTYAEGVVGAALRQNGTRKEIQISGPVAGGYSGSPVVLKDTNKLIGVLSNSPSSSVGAASIFMISSWEHVRALADLARS